MYGGFLLQFAVGFIQKFLGVYQNPLMGTLSDLAGFVKSPKGEGNDLAFHGGDFDILFHDSHTIAYTRTSLTQPQEVYTVIAHRGDTSLDIPLAKLGRSTGEIVLLVGEASCEGGVLKLLPDSACVIK